MVIREYLNEEIKWKRNLIVDTMKEINDFQVMLRELDMLEMENKIYEDELDEARMEK